MKSVALLITENIIADWRLQENNLVWFIKSASFFDEALFLNINLRRKIHLLFNRVRLSSLCHCLKVHQRQVQQFVSVDFWIEFSVNVSFHLSSFQLLHVHRGSTFHTVPFSNKRGIVFLAGTISLLHFHEWLHNLYHPARTAIRKDK